MSDGNVTPDRAAECARCDGDGWVEVFDDNDDPCGARTCDACGGTGVRSMGGRMADRAAIERLARFLYEFAQNDRGRARAAAGWDDPLGEHRAGWINLAEEAIAAMEDDRG